MKSEITKVIANLRLQADQTTDLNSAVPILTEPYLHYLQANFCTAFIPIDNQGVALSKGILFDHSNSIASEGGVIFHIFAEVGERFILDLEYDVETSGGESLFIFQANMFFAGDGFPQKVDLQLIDGLYSVLTPFKQNASGLAKVQILAKALQTDDDQKSIKYNFKYNFKNARIYRLPSA